MRSRFTWAPIVGGLAMSASFALAAPAVAATNTGQAMTFEATAYAPTAQDNYPYGAVDFYGRPLTRGDIAVDPSVIPLKSCLLITGYHSPYLPSGGFIGEADDEGGAIKGRHVDIYINASESQVNNFGIQSVKVTVLGKATNPSAAGTAACAGYENGQASTASGGTTAPTQTSSGSGGAASNQSAPTTTGTSGSTGSTSSGGSSSSSTASSFGASAAKLAEGEVGMPFVWGGTSPSGFDSSGLVQWIFNHLGVQLPRLSAQQYRATTRITKAELQPGDLVFFQTYKAGPSFGGVYVGSYDGIQHAFIAANNRNVGVVVNNLDSAKWTRLYYGAGRVTQPSDSSAPAQAASGSGSASVSSSAPSANASSLGASAVKLALSEVGRPYVWGGTSPAGFDCSGLVQWVYDHLGVQLPRLSGQQYRATTRITKAQLQPGDLVFFQTYKPGPSHVGIYIGSYNGIQHAFVAADNPQVGVEIDNLSTAKWTGLYYGAGRVTP